jgi:hypothetical protein
MGQDIDGNGVGAGFNASDLFASMFGGEDDLLGSFMFGGKKKQGFGGMPFSNFGGGSTFTFKFG